MDERSIAEIVKRVLQEVQRVESSTGQTGSACSHTATCAGGAVSGGRDGIFDNVEDAIRAARYAFEQFKKVSLDDRKRFMEIIREVSRQKNREWSELAVRDTKMGRVDHKMAKNQLAFDLTPGPEDLTTACVTGSNGMMIQEYAPFGVIGSIIPCTNPVAMIINHSLCMLSAGNTVVFAPHPAAVETSIQTVQDTHRALVAAGAPANLLTSTSKASQEFAKVLMSHEDVNLLVATGGPGVVKPALQSPKRAIVAGPGNPPVIVDETADIRNAAKSVYDGASFDNNMPCICEKECFVLSQVYDQFISEIQRVGAYLLNASQTAALAKVLVVDNHANRDYVGRNASVIAQAIGVNIPPNCDLLIAEVDKNHPFVVQELLMPVLGIVRVNSFEQAVAEAKEAEHGFRHTAIIHSQRMDRVTLFAREMNCNIFVVNGPCGTALGSGGEGWAAFTIAGQTGEGCCTPKTFSRLRRFSVKNSLRIV